MPTLSGRVTKCRAIVDGDNINASTVEGDVSFSFSRTLELRDLTAPENQGGGSAQPTPDPTAGNG